MRLVLMLLDNILPVAAGNFVGAAAFVGGMHWYLHLKK